jgi:rhodanese-related sulfurtransferase
MNTTQQQSARHEAVEKPFAERVAEARSEVPPISAADAHDQRLRDPDTLFIDPRPAKAIADTTGLIPGALNLTLDRLNSAGDLPPELASRSRPIIAACQGGAMGALAARALKHRGFTNVKFLDGGTQAWLDAGYPTER